MQTTKTPYELLVRWDESGKLKGAHIQWLYVTRDGDAIVTQNPGQPEPIDLSNGFPLQDVLNGAQAEALEALSQRDAKIAALDNAARKHKTEVEAAGSLVRKLERELQEEKKRTEQMSAHFAMRRGPGRPQQ